LASKFEICSTEYANGSVQKASIYQLTVTWEGGMGDGCRTITWNPL